MKLVKKLTNYTTPLSLGVVFSTCMIGCGPFNQAGQRLLPTQQELGGLAHTVNVNPDQITPEMLSSVEQFITNTLNPNHQECGLFLLTLLQELRKGNTVDVNRVYVDGKLIDEVSGNLTALHIATFIGDMRLIEALLVQGANTEATDSTWGCTPLMLTICHANQQGGEIAQLLLQHGANPNAINKKKKSVMQLAVRYQNKEVFKALLEHGINPVANISDTNKDKMLNLAVELGYPELVVTLLNQGTQPTNEQLATAVQLGHTAICQNLLNFGAAATNEQLATAVQLGHTAICEILLNAGADANATTIDDNNITVLMQAIANNNAAIVNLLLNYGANLHTGDSLLAFAIKSKSDLEIVQLLISRLAITNRDYKSPLQIARVACQKKIALVEELIHPDTSLSRLLRAIRSNQLDTVERLINTEKVNNRDYKHALEVAIEVGCQKEIAQLLLKQVVTLAILEGMDRNMDHLAYIVETSRESTVYALEHLTITVTHKLLAPYIVTAVYQGEVDKVRTLLQLGANPNTVDQLGHTLLMIAEQYGKGPSKQTLIDILLSAGAIRK